MGPERKRASTAGALSILAAAHRPKSGALPGRSVTAGRYEVTEGLLLNELQD